MPALLIDRLPNVSTASKTEPGRVVNGVKVNDAGLVQALLKYGTYDIYYYIRESSGNTKAEEYTDCTRLKALDLRTLEQLCEMEPDSLVFFTSSHHLAKYVPLRQFFRRQQWPICGLTHGLSANTLIPSYSWNYFSALQSNDAIICTTAAGQGVLRSIFANLDSSQAISGTRRTYIPIQTPIIPLGIEVVNDLATSQKSNGFLVLSIGRLSPSHKADLRPVIAAFLTVDGLPNDSTLILAGDDSQGHIAPSLQEFANGFVSPRKVVLMPDIAASMKSSLYQMADVALCLSDTYQETFGISVLEAMAAGLPVVAPSWNGYRDLVSHNDTGFLVPTYSWGDTGFLNAVSMLIDPAFAFGQRVVVDIKEMVRYLTLLSKDKTRAREMGMRGSERARTHFSWRKVIQQYERLWDELVEEGRKASTTNVSDGIGYIDYAKVFYGYPSGHINLESRICIPEHVETVFGSGHGAIQFSPPPIAGFSEELDACILAIVRESEQLSVREILDRIPHSLACPSMSITQLSRLLKYGFLTLLTTSKEEGHEVCHVSTLSPVSV